MLYSEIRRVVIRRRFYLLLARVETEGGAMRSLRAINYPGAYAKLDQFADVVNELNETIATAKNSPDRTLS